MEKKNALSAYFSESIPATFVAIGAVVGGGVITSLLETAGWEGPVPLGLIWFTSLIVTLVAGYFPYARLYDRHKELKNAARSAARLTPKVRVQLHDIKEKSGDLVQLARLINANEGADAVAEMTKILRPLAVSLGEHDNVRQQVLQYVRLLNGLPEKLDGAEDDSARAAIFTEFQEDQERQYAALIAACNAILDSNPPTD